MQKDLRNPLGLVHGMQPLKYVIRIIHIQP